MSVERAVHDLVAVLETGDDDVGALQAAQQAGRTVNASLDSTTDAERDAAAERLAGALQPTRPGAQAALTLGVLVEHGSPPAVVRPVLELLGEVLPAAARFVAAVGEAEPLDPEAEAAHPNPFLVGGRAYEVGVLQAASEGEPEGASAWLDLALWCLPTIAALTRDAPLRTEQRGRRALRPALEALRHEEGAGFLHLLLHLTLADEPLVALHPELARGFSLRATEITSVFQLHALLAAVLVPLGLPGQAPPPAIAACWRGEGPPSVPAPTTGTFQLSQWTGEALRNEEPPTDIGMVDGQRVVVLAEPAAERSWSTGRMFGALRSDLRSEGELSADEVTGWLDRLRAARR